MVYKERNLISRPHALLLRGVQLIGQTVEVGDVEEGQELHRVILLLREMLQASSFFQLRS